MTNWKTITLKISPSMHEVLKMSQDKFNNINNTDIKYLPYIRKIFKEWLQANEPELYESFKNEFE